jgi:hypothetical protein
MEYRGLGENNTGDSNNSGTFNFSRLNTGLQGVTSGNAIASFLLEDVDNANVTFYTLLSNYPRQHTWIFHGGDTWKITPKLSLNYGLRWDVATPTAEKRNNMSFFDFGPNPGADIRPGRLAFAGSNWGSASFGKQYPESVYYKAFQPRVGFAYSPDTKTVVRGGYGIFYTQAFYPGWGGGKRNATMLSIGALSAEETARLLASLLDQLLLPADVQAQVLRHAEGNPLYAEEYVRMLEDRGLLVHGPSGWQLAADDELPLPETVQGMIAARLDALAPAERDRLERAAVSTPVA